MNKRDVEKMKEYFKDRPMTDTLFNKLSTSGRAGTADLKKEWFKYLITTIDKLNTDIEKLEVRVEALENK